MALDAGRVHESLSWGHGENVLYRSTFFIDATKAEVYLQKRTAAQSKPDGSIREENEKELSLSDNIITNIAAVFQQIGENFL